MQPTNPPTSQDSTQTSTEVLFDPKSEQLFERTADAPILMVTYLSGAGDTLPQVKEGMTDSSAPNQQAELLCVPILHTEVKL